MIDGEYVVFSMDALNEMFYTLWYNTGSIFSVCIYTFMLVIGVYSIFQIVSHIGR